MQFNTYLYILAFLPLTVIGWFLLNKCSHKAALVFLIAVSLFFYAYAGLSGFVWLLISMVVNYGVVVVLERWHKKCLMWLGIVFNIALLFYFKYTNFAIDTVNQIAGANLAALDLVLPVGISFFTFQQISYLVDSYREGKTSLIDYLLYVTFFPKMLMGPIVKRDDLLPQFHDEAKRRVNSDNLIRGLQMFIFGLFKKVILADTFAGAVSWAWGLDSISSASSMDWLLVMLAYTFQIYFDFSGYSDMAIGTARMLNIELPMNFDSPYKAKSVLEFWDRWHISLTSWFREYVFFPIATNKKLSRWARKLAKRTGKRRVAVLLPQCIAQFITFLLSGLWHGANWTYVLWGCIHGLLCIFDRLTEKIHKMCPSALCWILSFLTINVLGLMLPSEDIGQWWDILCRVFSFNGAQVSGGLIAVFSIPYETVFNGLLHVYSLFENICVFWMLLFYIGSIFLCLAFENVYKRKYRKNAFTAIVAAVLLAFTVTCIGGESVFVYFNF